MPPQAACCPTCPKDSQRTMRRRRRPSRTSPVHCITTFRGLCTFLAIRVIMTGALYIGFRVQDLGISPVHCTTTFRGLCTFPTIRVIMTGAPSCRSTACFQLTVSITKHANGTAGKTEKTRKTSTACVCVLISTQSSVSVSHSTDKHEHGCCSSKALDANHASLSLWIGTVWQCM